MCLGGKGGPLALSKGKVGKAQMRRSWIIIENDSVLGDSDAAANEIRLREIYAGKELSEREIENIACMFYCHVDWQQN